MKVVIVEDEVLLAEELQEYLNIIDKSIDVVAKLTSVKDGIDWMKSNNCDLIFSDIELSDGLSFTIFSEVGCKTPIIFTTAYDKYAIQAFDLNSIGYLLKPFDLDDVQKVLKKYKENNLQYPQLTEMIKVLSESSKGSDYLNRIVLSLGSVQKPVLVKDVAFFMADDRYLFAFLDNNRKYYYDSTLSQLENKLDLNLFFRANRRFIVNKKFIDKILTASNGRSELVLTVGSPEKIIISYSKSNSFKQWIVS